MIRGSKLHYIPQAARLLVISSGLMRTETEYRHGLLDYADYPSSTRHQLAD